ncbi:sn-glycerol-3-phosphate ABC transporter ATP-binding protein UgpC [uncultured Bilophila sp.]|uniref:ABC transporter ATP-binding protein n=1 Tax=uncultured Bilophila sp. TaxID=529385 RepID=UPI00280A9A6E|nr:sn-glycerol-3-phosphate ABC transporter ATP-binding protein UgpC [uncultured Bilophila sp.]
MARVQLKNVEKTFNKNKVLKGLNVEVPDGSFMVMVGPSGCGKSTALRCIAGLEEVTGGSIFIGDEDVTHKEPKDRNIAMVFQNYALYPHMNVFDNITYGLKVRGIPVDERKRRAEDAAKLLGLDGLLDRMPKQLSGGQRQRVAMGRAIVREPSVFLFDEPLSNLDANLRNQMRIELRRLHQRLATTSIYVTHDQVEAMTLAEKILVLRAGNIEQYGTPDDIYLHPASVFVAQFMGSPSMNMIPATTDGEKLILPDGTPLSGVAASDIRLAAAPSKDVLVGLRCEDLLLDPEGPVQVTVDIIEALGPDTLAYCHPITGKAAGGVADQGAIIVRLPGTRRPAPGDAIRLSVRPGHGHVFDPASGLRCL